MLKNGTILRGVGGLKRQNGGATGADTTATWQTYEPPADAAKTSAAEWAITVGRRRDEAQTARLAQVPLVPGLPPLAGAHASAARAGVLVQKTQHKGWSGPDEMPPNRRAYGASNPVFRHGQPPEERKLGGVRPAPPDQHVTAMSMVDMFKDPDTQDLR